VSGVGFLERLVCLRVDFLGHGLGADVRMGASHSALPPTMILDAKGLLFRDRRGAVTKMGEPLDVLLPFWGFTLWEVSSCDVVGIAAPPLGSVWISVGLGCGFSSVSIFFLLVSFPRVVFHEAR
jgi:hypothetical protein